MYPGTKYLLVSMSLIPDTGSIPDGTRYMLHEKKRKTHAILMQAQLAAEYAQSTVKMKAYIYTSTCLWFLFVLHIVGHILLFYDRNNKNN